MTRTWGTVWVLAAVVVALVLGWYRPFRPGLRTVGTNVVIVVVPSVRTDELTPYGGYRDATPGLAAAARRGVRFVDVIPAELGGPTRGQHRALAEILGNAGYATFRTPDAPLPPEGGPAGGPAIDDVLRAVGAHPAGAPIFVEAVVADLADTRPVAPFVAGRFLAAGDPMELGVYRARLARLDEAVSRLAVGLDRLGYHEGNTLFAVVGLHRDGPGASVPWLLWGGGVARGHVVEGLASTVDVVPTLLGTLGVPIGSGPGHDWSGQVRGETDRTTRTVAYARGPGEVAEFTATRACHLSTGDVACFDRVTDPGETAPLATSDPDTRERLMAWSAEGIP